VKKLRAVGGFPRRGRRSAGFPCGWGVGLTHPFFAPPHMDAAAIKLDHILIDVQPANRKSKRYSVTALQPLPGTSHGLTRYAGTRPSDHPEARVQCRGDWRTRPSVPR